MTLNARIISSTKINDFSIIGEIIDMNKDLSVIDYQSKLVTYVFSPSHFQINAKILLFWGASDFMINEKTCV